MHKLSINDRKLSLFDSLLFNDLLYGCVGGYVYMINTCTHICFNYHLIQIYEQIRILQFWFKEHLIQICKKIIGSGDTARPNVFLGLSRFRKIYDRSNKSAKTSWV